MHISECCCVNAWYPRDCTSDTTSCLRRRLTDTTNIIPCISTLALDACYFSSVWFGNQSQNIYFLSKTAFLIYFKIGNSIYFRLSELYVVVIQREWLAASFMTRWILFVGRFCYMMLDLRSNPVVYIFYTGILSSILCGCEA